MRKPAGVMHMNNAVSAQKQVSEILRPLVERRCPRCLGELTFWNPMSGYNPAETQVVCGMCKGGRNDPRFEALRKPCGYTLVKFRQWGVGLTEEAVKQYLSAHSCGDCLCAGRGYTLVTGLGAIVRAAAACGDEAVFAVVGALHEVMRSARDADGSINTVRDSRFEEAAAKALVEAVKAQDSPKPRGWGRLTGGSRVE